MRHRIKYPDLELLDEYEDRIKAGLSKLPSKFPIDRLEYPRGFFINILDDTRLGVQLLIQAIVSNESLPPISSTDHALNSYTAEIVNKIAHDFAQLIYEKRIALLQNTQDTSVKCILTNTK